MAKYVILLHFYIFLLQKHKRQDQISSKRNQQNTCMVGSTMNLISETHHSCERREYTFMVLREYTIISLHLVGKENGRNGEERKKNEGWTASFFFLFFFFLFYKMFGRIGMGDGKDDDNPIASTSFNISSRERRRNGREDETFHFVLIYYSSSWYLILSFSS